MEKESIVAPVQIVLDAGAAARQLITSELQCHPGFADLHNRVGLLEIWDGRPELAARSFREALAINPGYFWAASNLAFALLGAGNAEEALEAFRDDGPFSHAPEFSLNRAAMLVEAGRPEQALSALASEPREEHPYWHHIAGIAHLKLSDRSRAGGEFARAARACPEFDRLYRQREFLGPGALEKVSPRAAAAPIRILPGLHELYEFFAEIYARHGFRSRALQSYEEAQVLWPHRARHAWNLGRLASWLGESREATAHFLEAITLDPSAVEAHIALGMEYAAAGDNEAATREFEQAAELRPGFADIRYQLGLTYVEAGRYEDAADSFREALSINPAFHFARLNLAQALRRKGDHAAAIEIYEQTIAAGRATADLYMNLGLAYLDMGEPVRAEDYFREGIETNPEFHLNYYYVGVACQRQGRRHQARQAWKLFLERHRETDLAEEVRRRLRED
jgi:protein O-GlcNAc transferase